MAYNEYWWLVFLVKDTNGISRPKIWRLPSNIISQMEADKYAQDKISGRPYVAFMTHNASSSEAAAVGRARAIEAGMDIDGSLSRMQHNFDPNNL